MASTALRKRTMPNGVTVADWLGTASSAARSAVAIMEAARLSDASGTEAFVEVVKAKALLRRAMEELDSVLSI